jgi:hydroxymethylpyrimidine pyrophosphatase-like HAD family hydrolase
MLTPRAVRAVKQLHGRGVRFAITSGRPSRGMTMLVEPQDMKAPTAAFNGGIIVLPDMTTVDARPIPADVAPAVVDAIRAHGLYVVWIYRSTESYATDPHAPHAEKEARNVQFQPTMVPRTTGCSTGPSRSSASATTTTLSPGARPRYSSSSRRTSQPPGRSPTTST